MAGFLLLLATTGPNPDTVVSGTIRRFGGVCLELEKWRLFGWGVVGHTYTVADTQNGIWREPIDNPPCADVREQFYLVRPPFDAPDGTYRICGLVDEQPCVEFSRVPFVGSPGP